MIRFRTVVLALAIGAVGAAAAVTYRSSQVGKIAPAAISSVAIQRLFEAGIDSLVRALAAFDSVAENQNVAAVRMSFRAARAAYKMQETLMLANGPNAAGVLNGPLPEDDDGPPQPLGQPAAFQRIEAAIFERDSLTAEQRAEIRADIATMRKSVVALRALTPYLSLTESHIANAMRTELAHITILGFAGFDSDKSGDAIAESAQALAGMGILARTAAETFPHSGIWTALHDTLRVAENALRTDSSALHVDRLQFISTHGAAIGRNINRLRVASNAIDTTLRAVWRSRAATVFDSNAFDATAYAPAFAMRPDGNLISLGEKLFRDPRLSGPGTHACATCHVPALAFTDGQPRHNAMGREHRMLSRNTPTLLNVALQPNFFADGSATTLEDQIRIVLSSPMEMVSSPELAANRIGADSGYRAAFVRLKISADSNGITEAALRSVLATYIRSLVNLNSRFDLAVQGKVGSITDLERRGFNLFMGKARCGTCHFAPLFSGVVPPAYLVSDPEIIGVPVHADTIRAVIDPDVGRAGVDNKDVHKHAFNVPTLRNIARTAPYMHNGAYATLEQVVDFYNRSGGVGVGATVPNQTLSSTPLHLSIEEQRAVIAFLKSLTDRAFEH